MKREVDPSSPGFCIMPWIHLCVWTDGRVVPCCDNQETVFGNVRTESIESAYNSPVARAFRKSMLEGKLPESCRQCSVPEKTLGADSLRKSENRKYSGKIDFVSKTAEDGGLPELQFASFDIRISNLCNFSCRTCIPINSSEFTRIEQKLGRHAPGPTVTRAFADFREFSVFLEKHVESIEEFYFSGGEPMLMREHYELLETLIRLQRTDVVLRYRSNLSRLSAGGRSVIDLWKRFPKIQLGASLDGMGERAEYIRSGTVWPEIVANRRRLMAEAPHVRFWLAPTVQLLNAFHVPEFHLEWVREGLVEPSMIHFNILSDPPWFSVQLLPPALKRRFQEAWMDYIEILSGYPGASRAAQEAMQVMRFASLGEGTEELRRQFLSEIRIRDSAGDESFERTFPELADFN
jgi:radical SAM protein with 4Fe4S-binding SPASM domain